MSTLQSGGTVDAQLMQVTATGGFSVGRLVWGTLDGTSSGFFGRLTIPQLMSNGGSKTGSIYACRLGINVPIAMPVTDDDVDQGPLRISLNGKITTHGVIAGDATMSSLILEGDPMMTPRLFAWTGARRP
jgi:hypothetical protein